MGTANTLDDALVLLAEGCRRRALATLSEERRIREERLAEEVWPDAGATDRRLIELHHVHLPRLSEHGYVRWERDAGVVRRGPSFGEAERLLDRLVDPSGSAGAPGGFG